MLLATLRQWRAVKSTAPIRRTLAKCLIAYAAMAATSRSAWAVYEVPDPAYAAPANYYSNATGTGTTLKSSLYTIISTGFISRDYGSDRYSSASTSKDPNIAGNILLAYNRASVIATWDNGITWNREHVWPKYWLNLTSQQVDNSYNGVASDEFELLPANPNINSNRGNLPYGGTGGSVAAVSGSYWYPGTADTGDVARSIFYTATRYGQGQTNNLSLVNGVPTARYTMGDLASLLKWNYADPIDNFERQKNQYVYSSALNPTYYQGNRNPYIDHPEYVWAVFGTSASDSKLYVGSTANSDGTSIATVNLGRVLVGSTLGTSAVTLNKSGTDPTTYNVTTAGEATTTAIGTGQTFNYNAQSRTVNVGLSSSTATAGLKTGVISIKNTDLTTAAAGDGAADGNDTVNVSATVLAHSAASFNSSTSVTNLTLDFGNVALNDGTKNLSGGISNLASVAGFTAGLNLNSITGSGNTSQLNANLSSFAALAAGSTQSFTANLSTAALGGYNTTYTLTTSDEALPGAASGATLTLTLKGNVLTRQWHNDADGKWSTSGNWVGAIPDATAATANFLNVITAPRTITLSENESVGSMLFDSAKTYTLSQGALILDNGAQTATINVNQGSHTIDSPMSFLSDTTITTLASTALQLNGGLTATGHTLTKNGAGQLSLAGAQMFSAVTFNAVAGTTTFISDPGSGVELNNNSKVNFSSASGVPFHLSTLTMSGQNDGWTSSLDLNTTDLIIIHGDLATVSNQIRSGFNSRNGYWAGTGISSSAAANDPRYLSAIGVSSGGFSFDGESTSGTDVLIKFTIYGDANLDGVVDGTDFSLIDFAYATPTRVGWQNGDFNYDGVVDGSDYSLMDNAFNTQASTATASAAQLIAAPTSVLAGVPEPSAGLILILAGVLGLGKHRRRQSI